MAAFTTPSTYTLDKPILQNLGASSASAVHPLGFRVGTSDGKEFMYVYMESGDVVNYVGSPAIWQDTTGDYVVCPDLSEGAVAAVGPTGGLAGAAGVFAGVFCMGNTDENACYLWIQTKGLVDGACVSSDVAANDPLLISHDDVFVDAQSYASSLSDVYLHIVGVALTAAAAHGTATGDQSTHSIASIMLV